MRAQPNTTTITKSWPRGRARHVVLVSPSLVLVIPAIANAQPIDSDPIDAGYSSSTRSRADRTCRVIRRHPRSARDSSYSSLNAITGSSADAPTFAASSRRLGRVRLGERPRWAQGLRWP